MKIAILEDVPEQAASIALTLQRGGYETVVRHDGAAFIELVKREKVDVLLLDWDVPGISGIEVLRWARSTLGDVLPILMVTHHDGEQDIVYGLNQGADDYLLKPVRARELLARITAQTRKYYPESKRTQRITVGRYTFDSATLSVTFDDTQVPLSLREFQLAFMLFSNPGSIVSREKIFKRIWGEIDRKYDASLATYVSKLRSCLALRRKNGYIISTVYNHGYRLELV